jgi:Spy/CpxP family protein refolding chaperone
MRKYIKQLSVILVILTTIGLAGQSFAKGKWHRRHRRFRKHRIFRIFKNPVVLKELGISKQKADKIINTLREARKKIIPLRAQIRVRRISLKQEFDKRTIDRDKVQQLLKEIHGFKWQIKDLRSQTFVKVLNSLTYEQREKIKEMRYRRCRRGRGFHRGPRFRRGRRFGRGR